MRKFTERQVEHCVTCSKFKLIRHAPFGQVKPMRPGSCPRNSLSRNVVTGLQESHSFNAILVVVNLLSKMANYNQCRDTATTHDVAQLEIANICKRYSNPHSDVFDGGSTVTSFHRKSLCRSLTLQDKFSRAFYLQTDGNSEQVSVILEQYLRGFVTYQ